MRGSQREYAKHRGVSHVAVGKAVKTGRIAGAVGADGKIDFERADLLWGSNTNAIQQARTGGGEKTRSQPQASRRAIDPPPPPPPTPSSSEQQVPAPSQKGTGGVSLLQAQTMKAAFQAQREKLAFEREAKKSIDADDVRVKAFTRGRQARDAMLAAPSRIGPKVVGLTDLVQIVTILEDEFREIARTIAEDAIASV